MKRRGVAVRAAYVRLQQRDAEFVDRLVPAAEEAGRWIDAPAGTAGAVYDGQPRHSGLLGIGKRRPSCAASIDTLAARLEPVAKSQPATCERLDVPKANRKRSLVSEPSRRQLLARLLAAGCGPGLGALPLAGCASVPDMPGPAPAARRLAQVAPGAFLLRGLDGEVDEQTLGRIGNAGFIVGTRGVVAIDAGVSYRHGQELLAAISSVTRLPVRRLFITHARQEFLFGTAAFRERGIPVAMQARTARLMAARCEGCLKTLNRVLGADAMRGSTMFTPDEIFDETSAVSSAVGAAIGRPVRILSYGHSSGPGDIAVLDETTATLFAGGLADHRHIPDVQDAELEGWRRALAALQALGVRRVVPGHGGVGGPETLAEVQRYLDRLETRLLELLRADAALSEVPDAASLPEFEAWDQYAIVHRRNASILFVRMEREQLVK